MDFYKETEMAETREEAYIGLVAGVKRHHRPQFLRVERSLLNMPTHTKTSSKTIRMAMTLIIATAILSGCAVPKNYSNGQPRHLGSLDAKKRKNGKWTYYYPDGKKRCMGKYASGKREGAWTWFYPNGKPRRILSFKDNRAIGTYAEYNDKGVLLAKGPYIDGKKQGIWSIFDTTGLPTATLSYRSGKLEGTCIFTTRKKSGGKWTSKEEFAHGKRRKAFMKSPDGKTFKLVIEREKSVFPWKTGTTPRLADEFMTMPQEDRKKITALLAQEDRFIKDASRRFHPHYNVPRDPAPKH